MYIVCALNHNIKAICRHDCLFTVCNSICTMSTPLPGDPPWLEPAEGMKGDLHGKYAFLLLSREGAIVETLLSSSTRNRSSGAQHKLQSGVSAWRVESSMGCGNTGLGERSSTAGCRPGAHCTVAALGMASAVSRPSSCAGWIADWLGRGCKTP